MKEVTVDELKAKIDNQEDFQLIDVREAYEIEIASIGGDHIAMNTVLDNVDKISKDKPVVIYCRSGKRSASVVQALEDRHGFDNLYNLAGGILEWAEDIDPNMDTY